MHYYGYIDENNICQGTYSFPSQISDPNYIYLGTTDDQSVVGKYWNATTQEWEEVTAFYYAILNSKDICTQVKEYPSVINDSKYIRIQSLDTSLVGKWYNRDTLAFEVAPVHILADHSTDVVNYKNQDVWLNDILDDKANSSDVYTKTQVDTLIDNIELQAGGQGLSAYQIAQNNGFVGTEEEWLASLKGETGETGATGETGVQGLSAYQVAVNNGFVGSETEWLASLQADVDTSAFALVDHTHDGFATSDELVTLQAVVDGKADEVHEHLGYADISHDHTIGDVAGLQSALNGMALSTHTHTEYAASNHTHNEYLSTSGGTVGGNLQVNGVVRVQGQQCIFNSGTMVTLGTNNLPTMIAGSSIYSKVAIQVSSDERLKDVKGASDKEKALNLIKNLNVVDYAYKDTPNDDRVGVIAQELEKLDERFVKRGEDGYLYVRMNELIFPLIIAVQELLKK